MNAPTCACGCGRSVERAKWDSAERGVRKGEFNRFVKGHRAGTGPSVPEGVLVDEQDAALFASRCWRIAANGYVVTTFSKYDTGHGWKREYLHRMICAPAPGLVVDHINGDKLDNRRSNLRVVTQAENARNLSRDRKNNTSGFRGVTWSKRDNCWVAQATLNGRNQFIGHYVCVDAAALAVAEWRKLNMLGYVDRG